MAIRVNPRLIESLELFGADDVSLCYHCGDCSAVCSHSTELFRFPRKSTRMLQMGLERKLETSLEPWLCYYCGQCSEQCPREAAPGETMMSLRRWLISRYDLTGLAARFYRSSLTEVLAVVVTALLTGLFLLYYGFRGGDIRIYDGTGAFLPSSFIHRFDLVVGSVMALFLLTGAFRMWYLIMLKGSPFQEPIWLYLKNLYLLPWHFFTQSRYYECKDSGANHNRIPWLLHLGLMLGYVTMLVLVMVFLPALQAGPTIDWRAHVFGYLASAGLLAGAFYFIRSRKNRTQEQYKKSHSTDWMFIILLSVIIWTGILQHLFHRLGVPVAANITYVIHLMAVVPWLLRMPFSKWSHMVYRPLAMYFAAIRSDAAQLREVEPVLKPVN